MEVLLYLICLCLIIFGLFLYLLITRKYGYWKAKNVPHLQPSLLFGNYKDYILLKKPIGKVASEICERFPDAPYVGTYYGTEPALLLQDPEVIKHVLAKDFNSFNGREISNYTDQEIITQCMFFTANDSWKLARQNLTPLFSTTKMKNMFHLIENCSNNFEKYIMEQTSSSPMIEAKTITSRYTMDCICACVFGINSGLMETKDDSNPLLVIGREIFDVKKWRNFKLIVRSIWPYIFYKFGFRLFADEVHFFMHKIITDVMKSRQSSPSLRHDFVDLLMTWKKFDYLEGTSLLNGNPLSIKVTDDLIVSQCALLFAAGFETSSSALAFLMFELAKNKAAQTKLVEEVDAYLTKNSGKIEYECVNEMPYLEACFKEVMRLYPLFTTLTRETMHDYTFPTGLQIEKGVRIHIPILHLHRNPKYFPEPELFRPERFLGDEKSKIIPYTYIPFGEGPRICIGMRFAKMQTTPIIMKIFKNFTVELDDNMPKTLNFVPGSLVTHADTAINVKFISRADKKKD